MLADTDGLIKIGVFVLFFLVPVIKSVLDAKKKQREAVSRRDEAPTTDPDTESDAADQGREAWEALLRGEVLTETREKAPPPVVAPPERRARRSFEDGPETPYTPSMSGEVASLPERGLTAEGSARERRIVLTDSEPLTRTRALTETESLTNAPALTDSEALTNSPALTDTPATEGIPIAKLVAQGAFQDLGEGSVGAEQPVVPARAAFGRSRADWRRALIASEVLGAPVSMRPWGAGAPRVSGGQT
ncbi:MAG: hypothetical protein K8S98_01300 [Planctomycetes bacterium]|nr:hypothetical protein [Planctomycetota bacterium]